MRLDPGAGQAVGLLDAGRRGDVDLGQPVADHVDADEDQPARPEVRADARADLPLPVGQHGLLRLPAGVEIGARLSLVGHARDGAGDFAVDQNDALVALADLRQVALGDDRLAELLGIHFQQRAEIVVAGPEVEHAGAAVTVERLDDDVAMLVAEPPDRLRIARDQGRRHQVRIAVDVDFLRRVAHLGRVVHHQRRRVDMLEKMGRRDVGQVEGRILAQQDHVHLREVGEPRFAEVGMVARLGPHRQALHRRAHRAVAEAQPVRRVVMQRMAARLGFHGQHEGAVRPDVDAVDRIHLDRDAERHVMPRASMSGPPAAFAGSPKANPPSREAGRGGGIGPVDLKERAMCREMS